MVIRLFQTQYEEVFQILNEAKLADKSIRIRQSYDETVETKSYRFNVRFPNGFKSQSVAAWYCDNWKIDRSYMTTREMANYICNVNSGRGGKGISYTVEVVN